MTIKGIHAREVRNIIREKGIERGTIYILEHIVEYQTELKRQLFDIAQMVNQLTNITSQVVSGVHQFKRQIENFGNEREDDLGASTQGLSDDDKSSD